MLEIQNNCIVFHKLKNIHHCLYIGGICVQYKQSVVQVQVCYTSNLIGPKAHNIIYVNKNFRRINSPLTIIIEATSIIYKRNHQHIFQSNYPIRTTKDHFVNLDRYLLSNSCPPCANASEVQKNENQYQYISRQHQNTE